MSHFGKNQQLLIIGGIYSMKLGRDLNCRAGFAVAWEQLRSGSYSKEGRVRPP
jgi:hypothetical protein